MVKISGTRIYFHCISSICYHVLARGTAWLVIYVFVTGYGFQATTIEKKLLMNVDLFVLSLGITSRTLYQAI